MVSKMVEKCDFTKNLTCCNCRQLTIETFETWLCQAQNSFGFLSDKAIRQECLGVGGQKY